MELIDRFLSSSSTGREYWPSAQGIEFTLAHTAPTEAALPDELNRPNPPHTFSIPLSS